MRREGIREATPAELDSDADKLRSKRRSELAQPAEQEPSGFAKYGYPHALLDPAEQEPSFIAELPSERDNAIAIVREMRANAEQELRGDVPTKTVGTDRSASAERDVFERFSEDYCITPSEVTLAVFARTRFGDAVKALEFYAAQDGQPRGPGATIAWKAREALALLSPPDAGGKKEL
jgi:hypothetical protein